MKINTRWTTVFCALGALSLTTACGDDDGDSSSEPDAGETETETEATEETEMMTESTEATDPTDAATDETDGTDVTDPDAGPDSGTPPIELPEVEALCAGLEGDNLMDCGAYIVNNVVPCGDCHTPRDADGLPMEDMFLAGNAVVPFLDIAPDDDEAGAVWPANLTPDEDTGLGSWSADEIKDAFQNGVRPDGSVIFPVMPYQEFHNMQPDDADAIVAYLQSIPAVENEIPESQVVLPGAPPPIPLEAFPPIQLDEDDPDYEDAVRGLYIAGYAGSCLGCHTPLLASGMGFDYENMFTGGRVFPAAEMGLPVPPFPEEIYTSNLTPHSDGLEGWTKAAIVQVLKDGLDDDGQGICPPMPAGPMRPFGGMTDSDAEAVATYLLSIDGRPNTTGEAYPECVAPQAPPPMTDGGVPEVDAGPAPDAGDAG